MIQYKKFVGNVFHPFFFVVSGLVNISSIIIRSRRSSLSSAASSSWTLFSRTLPYAIVLALLYILSGSLLIHKKPTTSSPTAKIAPIPEGGGGGDKISADFLLWRSSAAPIFCSPPPFPNHLFHICESEIVYACLISFSALSHWNWTSNGLLMPNQMAKISHLFTQVMGTSPVQSNIWCESGIMRRA